MLEESSSSTMSSVSSATMGKDRFKVIENTWPDELPRTSLRTVSTNLGGLVPPDRVPTPSLTPTRPFDSEARFTLWSPSLDLVQGQELGEIMQQPGGDDRKGGQPLLELVEAAKAAGDSCCWVDVCGVVEGEEMRQLGEHFCLHPLTVEDVLTDQREKSELFEAYLFLSVRTVDQRPGRLYEPQQMVPTSEAANVNIYMIIMANCILTLHAEPCPQIRHVLRRLYPLKRRVTITPDWIMYALLDDVVDEFGPALATVEMETDSIDDLVLLLSGSDQSDMLRRIQWARRRVTNLSRLLTPKIEVVKYLTKRCPERLQTHTLLYLRDIQDHLLTMIQNLEHYSETLNRSHSNYLAQISIELNQASNRMSLVMKKLTVVASLIGPLSLISGIWGMNIPLPFTPDFLAEPYHWVPFTILVIGMACVSLLMWVIGRRQDWF